MRTKLSILLLLVTSAIYAQVQPMGYSDYSFRYRVNIGGGTYSTTHPAASLELRGTTSGFLPNRLTTVQRDAIASPATGLIIYNTTTNQVNVYSGSAWEAVGGVGNFIQNQYLSRQAANAKFDSIDIRRTHIANRLTASMTEHSWIHLPFQTGNNTANVGFHFSNLPLWDAGSRFYNAYATGVEPLISVNRNQGGASVGFYRDMYENRGDTNRLDYSQQLQVHYRYNFDNTIKTYDSLTGLKKFYPNMPGINSNVQYFMNGGHTRWLVGQTGNNSAQYTGTLAFFNAGGGTVILEGEQPLAQYFADFDGMRDFTTSKKVIRGPAGISQFYGAVKFGQNYLTEGVGNNISRINFLHLRPPADIPDASYSWDSTKAQILASTSIDTLMFAYIPPIYTLKNEIRNGIWQYQEGTHDRAILRGKTFHIGAGGSPSQADHDTTTALTITKGREWMDSLSTSHIKNVGLSGTGTRPLYIDASGNLTAPTQAIQTLTDGATVTWDMNLGVNAIVTLGGNRTLAITNATAGIVGIIKVIQDGTGSRTITLPAGSYGSGTITLTTTAGAYDILSFWFDGTNYNWNITKNYTAL